MSVVHYIGQNPARANLTDAETAWPFAGSVLAGWPTLDFRREDFWPRFWEIYTAAKVSPPPSLGGNDAFPLPRSGSAP